MITIFLIRPARISHKRPAVDMTLQCQSCVQVLLYAQDCAAA
jgi:hypothetical protein